MMTRTLFASCTFIVGSIAGCGMDGSDSEPEGEMQVERQTVTSADGTRIGFTRVGSGPTPVVIVHGALNAAEHWMPVARSLSEHCTCYVMDRWGRGGSGDRTDYAFEREIEDIQAVLAEAGPDAYLLGHSSGAIYALEAGLDAPIAGLVLYEPPLHAGAEFESIFERVRVAANEERFEDAVSIFLLEEARIPEEELSFLQGTPVWETMVALAPQSVREWEALVEATPPVDRYEGMEVPTLLLTGTHTEEHPSFATRALDATLPDARVSVLDEQGHSGHQGAPDLLAGRVADFILETPR